MKLEKVIFVKSKVKEKMKGAETMVVKGNPCGDEVYGGTTGSRGWKSRCPNQSGDPGGPTPVE